MRGCSGGGGVQKGCGLGGATGRSSEGAVEDVDRRTARRDKANGFYV